MRRLLWFPGTLAFLILLPVSAAFGQIPRNPQAVVHTFSNTNPITINDNATASLYPSQITVSGVNPATVTNVQVILSGFSHTFPDDVDMILVGPQGQRAMLMSDAGGSNPGVTGITLTFDQTSANILPNDTAPATGTYRPANYDDGSGGLVDTFPAPGPGALTDAPADLSAFNLTDPNGAWSLYVVDDFAADSGSISGGWALVLTVPQVFTVTKTDDTDDGVCDADCSLREALALAQNDDLINFSPLFNTPQTINLLTALPDITKSVTIQGPGANLLTVQRDFNAATNFRVFNVAIGITNGVSISGMTITGGNVGNGNFGGGIYSFSNLTLTSVHVTGNQADNGGGVALDFADGTFTNCTFSGNTAGTQGGGIEFESDGGHTLTLTNSTVSGNRANGSGTGGGIFHGSGNGNGTLAVVSCTIVNNSGANGGGIHTVSGGSAANSATTTLSNTIVANNTPTNFVTATHNGSTAAVTSQGFNLSDNYNGVVTLLSTDITAQPLLGPLSLNGGQTPTHALLGGSPALDKGSATGTDQRGLPRQFNIPTIAPATGGNDSDIGAVEMQALIVTTLAESGAGSLRDAITTANTNAATLADIIFSDGLTGTIDLESALDNITASLTINGPGANLLTVRRAYDATSSFSVFSIAAGVTDRVAMSGMTISNGYINFGGGIDSLSNLTLTNVDVTGNWGVLGGGVAIFSADGVFTGCTFSGNKTNLFGGGIYFQGGGGHTLRLLNCTISGNYAASKGGGVLNRCFSGDSKLQVVSCTIVNNSGAGGIESFAQSSNTVTASTTLRNTIIAGNTPSNLITSTEDGGVPMVTSLGYNLASDDGGGFLTGTGDITHGDAKLGPLSFNGGQTPTHALLGGSPALDKGSATGTDQRGLPRQFNIPTIAPASGGNDSDIGAVEMQALIVNSNADPGDGVCDATCTLRDAITAANANGAGLDDIIFDNTVFNTAQTITLSTVLPDIASSVTINGPGANLLTVRRADSAPDFTVFNIPGPLTNGVAISGMTISNGRDVGGPGQDNFGGGIDSSGNLTLTNVHVTGSTAGNGGGVSLAFADGVFTNCTFSNNSSTPSGSEGGDFL